MTRTLVATPDPPPGRAVLLARISQVMRRAINARTTCRHGIPITRPDAYNCWYYENPEHLKVDGPGRRRHDE